MTETTPETARLTADVALFGWREGSLYVAAIRRGWANTPASRKPA